MCKKLTSLIVAVVLVLFACSTSIAGNSHEEKEAKFIEKVKTGIAKLGTGPTARIEVSLRDKTKLKGYVSQVNDAGFVLADEKTGTSTEVPYPQVKQVKGNNLSTGAKIAIGIGIGILIMLLVVGIANGNG